VYEYIKKTTIVTRSLAASRRRKVQLKVGATEQSVSEKGKNGENCRRRRERIDQDSGGGKRAINKSWKGEKRNPGLPPLGAVANLARIASVKEESARSTMGPGKERAQQWGGPGDGKG